MFNPPPEEETSHNFAKNRNKSRARRNKKLKFIKREISKRKYRFALNMTTWAESFTHAATWRLQNEVAYWKAKAKSLQYENEMLHNVIRENSVQHRVKKNNSAREPSESEDEELHYNLQSRAELYLETEEESGDDEEFELSEEFLNFVRENAKYKEDARLEREKLRAQFSEESTIKQMEAGPSGPRDKVVGLKEMYGDNWQKIAALEMYIQSKFNESCDTRKPVYWPNIPFNFNFS